MAGEKWVREIGQVVKVGSSNQECSHTIYINALKFPNYQNSPKGRINIGFLT